MRRAFVLILAVLLSGDSAMASLTPSNVLTRVFQLRYKGGLATIFTLDVDGRQYLITARHAVPGIASEDIIELRREVDWVKVRVKVIPVSPPEVDIAVLAPDRLISPTLPLDAGMKDLYVSQDVAFVGFPYGMLPGVTGVNQGYPLPFVKHGICSAFDFHDKRFATVWIDGQNNEGFSGGPVVFTNSSPAKYAVAAVVSGYRWAELPVLKNGADTGAVVRSNSGLMLAFGIDAALAAIRAKPIGAPLAPESE